MPIFCCCFCFQQFDNTSGLGNHQWRCVPIENSTTVIDNNVSLLPTNNNNIKPWSQQPISNEVNCNVLDDNDNLFMLAEGYDDEIDDEEFNVNAVDIAVADKYDTIDLLDDDWDESSVESNHKMGEENNQTMNTDDTNGDVIITKDGSMETVSSSLLEYKCFTEINKAMGSLLHSMVAAIKLLSLLRTSGLQSDVV